MNANLGDDAALDPREALVVDHVSDRATVHAWFSVFGPAFELSRAAASAFRDLILAGGLGESAPMRNYIGYVGSEPVATGSLVPAAGVGRIYQIRTPPSRPGGGIRRALTW